MQEGSRSSCVLTGSLQRKHLISSHLEFECMNNTKEYEALILGLHKPTTLNVVVLKVVGDSEITVCQVCNTIHYVSPHIKSYQQEVWRLISQFQAFNIILVPRIHNEAMNSLVKAAARMTPLRGIFSIDILYKWSVPKRVTNLCVFEDDQ